MSPEIPRMRIFLEDKILFCAFMQDPIFTGIKNN
jgi:hypothetical protein